MSTLTQGQQKKRIDHNRIIRLCVLSRPVPNTHNTSQNVWRHKISKHETGICKRKSTQECIPVGCVPPAHWPGGGGCMTRGGVWLGGVCLTQGCLTWGGCLTRGKGGVWPGGGGMTQGGCLTQGVGVWPGGRLTRGGLPMLIYCLVMWPTRHPGIHSPPVDR